MSLASNLTAHLSRIIDPRRVISDEQALEKYAVDESNAGRFPPAAVVLVENADEAAAILNFAQQEKIYVTPRGLGTGMTGGALPICGGIVICTERMTKVHEIDEENLIAVVDPGIVTGHFQSLVEERGLFYPPDPASLDSCSLGGNVAENAGGPRAFKYGVTRNYVLGLEVVLPSGEKVRLGRRTVKGVTGFDLVSLLVGSEGLLGLITKITVQLIACPESVSTFLAAFSDAGLAAHTVTELIRAGFAPRTLEFIDGRSLDYLRQKNSWPIPIGAGALLLVEIDGEAEEVEKKMFRAAELCERSGAQEILVATDEARRRQMWEMRRNLSTVLKELNKFKASQDIVVPRATIPEMVKRLGSIAMASGLDIACFGHAGDGNLHINILANEQQQWTKMPAVQEQIFSQALQLGGTLSGEHGIGLTKKRYVPLEHSREVIALGRRLKQAFDPEGLFNPGKVLPDIA